MYQQVEYWPSSPTTFYLLKQKLPFFCISAVTMKYTVESDINKLELIYLISNFIFWKLKLLDIIPYVNIKREVPSVW